MTTIGTKPDGEPCLHRHKLRYEARLDRLGTRLWDTRGGCWISAAHPNQRWMEELAVMMSLQSQVRDEIRIERQRQHGVREIRMYGGRVALVDAADYDELSAYTWSVTMYGYAVRQFVDADHAHHSVLMHRHIMRATPFQRIDHINHNKLDNRRVNLRFCTHAQNCKNRPHDGKNTSGYKGVSWSRNDKKWMAMITSDKETYYLGLHVNLRDAVLAYNNAARVLHGEFACLNPLPSVPNTRDEEAS